MTFEKYIHIIQSKFPSKGESWLVFSACIFPVHFWMTFVLLYNLNSILLKADLWQAIAIFAYSYSLALLESILLFTCILLLAVILPQKALRDRFVYLGTSLAFIISAIALITNTPKLMNQKWLIMLIGLGILLYLGYVITRPLQQVSTSKVAERLTVMSILFLSIDILLIFYLPIRRFTL